MDDATPWYADAVVYQLHVRAFFDSDADGVGDFRGLVRKLDYLEDLGVTAVWLLPFYPSPLRDEGYDISDYTGIHPDYGTLDDFRYFLREAHRRGLRVITELVLNHTSDQHPWFRRARRAPAGSPEREMYVWSDTPDRYAGARVIFRDFESSNWTWDSVAGAYYWHRFYSHQPDLNYDSPRVRAAMLEAVDFWLRLGVDGLRLDAVPYLFEREGTTCENLPETHAFLKELRAHVEARFPGRLLLAEANQWPADAVHYFGDGDECQMAFHFPLMPRMFMAVRMEDRVPIVDILTQTPEIPPGCRWALFLRNHDELTLEMVTDEERDYMYRAYAEDPEARLNAGIRRRLAPLLGGDRRMIELLNGLLFSLDGTPVVYYGDEIGMGDNIYLGDRAGVRTPMQWSADRNAGFSRANPQRLYLPVIIDPEYHAEALNVEAQRANPNSLLSWMRRLIALRRRSPALSRGSLDLLFPDNPRVLAFLRRHEDEQVLVVANLSRVAQYVELDLRAFEGTIPVELFGGTRFPRIGEWPYLLTLGPHAFYWFSLAPERARVQVTRDDLPTVEVPAPRASLLAGRAAGLGRVLPAYLEGRRWFGGKGRRVARAAVEEAVAVRGPRRAGEGEPAGHLALVRVDYADGGTETYLLPLALRAPGPAGDGGAPHPVARVRGVDGEALLVEALDDRRFCLTLLDAIASGRTLAGARGKAVPERIRPVPAGDLLEPSVPDPDHSNSAVAFGDRLLLKVFRRLEEGESPELELGRALTALGSGVAPALVGALGYVGRDGRRATLAVLQELVPHEGDAWSVVLRDLVDRAASLAGLPLPPARHPLDLLDAPPPGTPSLRPFLETAAEMGTRTARLHRELASVEGPGFAPEPFTPLSARALHHAVQAQATRAFDLLREPAAALPEARAVLDLEREVRARLRALLEAPGDAVRIRIHGDLHLGQILTARGGPVVIDFEGDPARPVEERRAKRPPLQDVAGMLRSFDYAAHAALGDPPGAGPPPWLRAWTLWVSAAYLRAYLEAARGTGFAPRAPRALRLLLDALLVDKALAGCAYEAGHRPAWLAVPARGLRDLVRPPAPASPSPMAERS